MIEQIERARHAAAVARLGRAHPVRRRQLRPIPAHGIPALGMAAFRLHRLDLAVEELGALGRVERVVADAVVVSAVVVVVDGAAAVRARLEVEEPDLQNGDEFTVSETDSATNQESSTILRRTRGRS